ncbi:Protein CHAPERONE-LIKE PROTEIN OF POR1-like [Dillenia turbinata]|uniref:Protein CHAPERONE-LIKE PROTEIN OF POR1-like n=1 Tax=Dillenia turbinata TaxID=194707 RepID=A0AAN8WEH8_9MAGN
MATSLSVRPNSPTGSLLRRPSPDPRSNRTWSGLVFPTKRALNRTTSTLVVALAGSRADEPAPTGMTVENALKLLGVSENASFDDILSAKNSILATCKDDKDAVAQVEAAYDMLLMQSLTQRRAGKVASSTIRYADVKPVSPPGIGSMPQWLQATVKKSSVSVETPTTGDFGIQAGVYGALMVLTYANGSSASSAGLYTGADVPGLILASGFGASLYFMTKRSVKLGKATIITIGGLVAGAVVGSAVENWLQVDIVPFLGIQSPATVVSEFILFFQFLVSLYLRNL